MNNYIDAYGRYHNKPVTSEDPVPSNNGWIYTAYAAKLGLPFDREELRNCYNQCIISVGKNFSANRSPGKNLPPLSRDEVLGMCYFNFPFYVHYYQNWNFSPYPLPKFSLIKLIKQLWELRPSVIGLHLPYELKFKHRNYFWQNNLDQLYRFAFSVPIQDRAFILKQWDKFQWYNPAHIFYSAVAKIDSMMKKK
jgi:hypothetical protein